MTTDADRTAGAESLVASFRPRVANLLEQAGKFGTLETDEEVDAAGRLVRKVKAAREDIAANRLAITRPLDAHKASIMAMVKPLDDDLADAEQSLKGSLDEQRRAQQAILDAEVERVQALLEQALAEGDFPAVDAALEEQLASPARDKAYMPAGTSLTRHLKVEVTDLVSLVWWVVMTAHEDLLLPNLPTIRALAREAVKGGWTIPGVKAEYVEGVGVTNR